MNCKECGKRMVPTKIRYEFKHEGLGFTLKAINVPAMKCPDCSKLEIEKDMKQKIFEFYLNYPEVELLDYEYCNNETIDFFIHSSAYQKIEQDRLQKEQHAAGS